MNDSGLDNYDPSKINSMSFTDYLKRLESQLLSGNNEIWENKTANEIIMKFTADAKGFQENVKQVFEITKKFINKFVKYSDKEEDKAEFVAMFQAIISGLQCVQSTCPPKIQIIVVEECLNMASITSSETTEEETIGSTLTEAFLSNSTYMYEALIKKQNMKASVPAVKNSLTNYKSGISAGLNTACGTILQYIGLSAKSVMSENAKDFWPIGVKIKSQPILGALAGSIETFKSDIPKHFDEFMQYYRDELESAFKSTVTAIVQVGCTDAPEIGLKYLELLAEELDSVNKYYIVSGIAGVAKKYPDEVYKNCMDALKESLEDKLYGAYGADVLGNIGKNTKNEEYIKNCVDLLCQTIIDDNVDNIIMFAMNLKQIAEGEGKQKELMKASPLAEKIEKAKGHKDQKISEQVQATLDILHGRNLEKLDKKIDDLKQEMIDYVNSQIETIKKDYNKAVKTLPMPVDIEVKKSVMNTIFLKFECAMRKNEECEYQGKHQEEGEYFKTKTKEINKWCKIGASVIAMGKSAFVGDVGGALGALADTFSAAKADDQGKKHFKALMEEPFLTSSEQDRLILQLREANYFNSFSFDSSVNGWVCHTCKPFERKTEASKDKSGCKCTIF